MAFFAFKKRRPPRREDGVLPVLELLLFHASPENAPALVDVGPPGSLAGIARPAAACGARYEIRTCAASDSLQQWAAMGARFDMSRLGGIRVWSGGQIRAAESEADCCLYGGRTLSVDEVEYLGAYLHFIDRQWSDPDVPAAAGEA